MFKKILIAALLALVPGIALAQSAVTQQPLFVAPRTVLDMGNGPLEVQLITGSAGFFTSQGSGVGSGTTTAITLTATPPVPPCVGCAISGAGITGTTLVTAYNGTTGITVNTSQTIGASTPLSWGAACPVSTQTTPVQPPTTSLMAMLQAGVGGAVPFGTGARLCSFGAYGPGAQFVTFTIGAH